MVTRPTTLPTALRQQIDSLADQLQVTVILGEKATPEEGERWLAVLSAVARDRDRLANHGLRP